MAGPRWSTRTRRAAAVGTVLALAAALLGGCGPDEQGRSPFGIDERRGTEGDTDLEAVEDGTAPEVVEHADEWPAPGRDLRNSRAVPDSPISSATIDDLAEAWTVDLPGPGVLGNAASGPVVVDGTVIVQDLSSTVRAIDLDDGAVRWEATYELPNIGPNGPAVGYDRVFVAKGMREIVALDLRTGREIWATSLPATATEGIDIQPQVFGGLVYASTVPISLQGQYTGGDRGVLFALDAGSGEVRWTFDTVGGEDVWGNPEVNSGGGAWFTPAVDVANGTILWGIANPAPFPGTPEHPNGSSRPGPNLYTDSVVALDALTGGLRWYHQAVEHDLFDRDLIHTLLVTDAEGREVVVGTGKMGRVLGLDPVSGDLLWDTPVGVHRNDDLTELDGPTEVFPGTYGGVLTPPSSADGVVYVPVINAPTTLSPDRPSYIGSELGTNPGEVVAVDATDGEVLWATEVDGDPLGGTIVLGDLVLTGLASGLLVALDRETGRQVWEQQASGGLNGWPAATGDTLLWPIGSAEPAHLLALRLGA